MTPLTLRTCLTPLLLSLGVLCSGPAAASPASATFTAGSFPSGTPFDIRFHGALLGQNDPFDLPAPWAGQMILQSVAGDTFLAWCVDLFHDLNVNGLSPTQSHSYTATPLTTDSSGSSAATSNPLTPQQVHDVLALANYGNQQLAAMAPGLSHDVFSGQVQVAIWDTVYKGRISYQVLGSAIGGVTPQDFADGVTDLEAMAPGLSIGSAMAMLSLDGSGLFDAQGIVGNFAAKGTMLPVSATAVPEPTSLSLMGFGLLLAGVAARKRRPA